MSYDLFFRSSALPSAQAIREYFSGRPHYDVRETQAWYENPTTGVYFSFDFGGDAPSLSFNLNYNRPAFFGLEAEPEVTALVAHFDLGVEDPQMDGMGEGPYSPEGFLRGWNAGNRFGVSATRARGSSAPALPEATNTGVWRWNGMREAYLDALGSLELLPTFVPTIMLLAPEDDPTAVHTAVVWSNAMAFMLPRVDRILVKGSDESLCALSYEAVAPLVQSLPLRPADYTFKTGGRHWQAGLAHRVIEEDLRSGALFDLLTQGGEALPKLTRIAPDQVIDRELLEG